LKTALYIAVIGGFLFLNGCPASRPYDSAPAFKDQELSVAGPYTHKGTGTVFPEQFGGFTRVRLARHDAVEENISAGYNLNSSREPILLTLYVYPGPRQAAPEKTSAALDTVRNGHFAQTLLAILAFHENSKLIDEAPFPLEQPDGVLAGQRALLQFHERLAGQEVDCTSLLYLFYDGEWFYKYRITCPTWAYGLAEESIESFVSDFLLLPAQETE